jgi:hypothetical protein
MKCPDMIPLNTSDTRRACPRLEMINSFNVLEMRREKDTRTENCNQRTREPIGTLRFCALEDHNLKSDSAADASVYQAHNNLSQIVGWPGGRNTLSRLQQVRGLSRLYLNKLIPREQASGLDGCGGIVVKPDCVSHSESEPGLKSSEIHGIHLADPHSRDFHGIADFNTGNRSKISVNNVAAISPESGQVEQREQTDYRRSRHDETSCRQFTIVVLFPAIFYFHGPSQQGNEARLCLRESNLHKNS